MPETRNPIATALGTYYPRHYIVAVIDDPSVAAKARDALSGDGFAEANVELCPGPDFVKNWDVREGVPWDLRLAYLNRLQQRTFEI